MLDDLVGDPDWVTQDYAGIMILAHDGRVPACLPAERLPHTSTGVERRKE